jgi:hypothetical protein
LQLGFGVAARGQLVLGALIEPRILDRDGSLSGDGDHRALGDGGELVGFGMAEEEPAQNFAGTRDDGYGKV